MRRTIMVAAAAALTSLALTGCMVANPGGPAVTPSAQATSSVPAASPNTPQPQTDADEYTLVQEPEDGFTPIYDLITSAKTSIEMTMYELEDPTATADLIAAAHRGVKVRVILDRDFAGAKANADAYSQLQAGGVQVDWAPSDTIYHQKTITVDGTVSAIGTANLTSQYYTTTRDAWIIDRNQAQVYAIEQTFDNDFGVTKDTGASAQAPGILWSPDAQASMVASISAAKTSVDFTSEELSDSAVAAALEQDARRGVTCEIVMTKDSDYYPELGAAEQAGCQVHLFPDSEKDLYMHEKIVLTDGSNLLIGSQNASVSSLTYNRELSVELTSQNAPSVVTDVLTTFNADFADAPAWSE